MGKSREVKFKFKYFWISLLGLSMFFSLANLNAFMDFSSEKPKSSYKTSVIQQVISDYQEVINVNSCIEASEQGISGMMAYSICSGDSVLLKVGYESVSDPLFTWFGDISLTDTLGLGPELWVSPSTSTSYYVSIRSAEFCDPGTGATNEVVVNVNYKPLPPTLPDGLTYISPEGEGIIVIASYLPLPSPNIEIIWLDKKGEEVSRGSELVFSKEFPLGTYVYSVVGRNFITGCISEPIEFIIYVLPKIQVVENCSMANTQFLVRAELPCTSSNCFLISPNDAVDGDPNTYSTINIDPDIRIPGGFVGQDLRFDVTGQAGDSVKLILSFPSEFAELDAASSVSLALFNGTSRVGQEYRLNSPEISYKIVDGKYNFYIPAFAEYEKIRIVSYAGEPTVIQELRIHQAEISFGIPEFESNIIEVCQGDPVTLKATPAKNTNIRWYDAEVDGVQLRFGDTYTTPRLLEPGLKTFWLAVVRENCESLIRYPIQVKVNPAPSTEMVEIAVDEVYCNGSTVVITPIINPAFIADFGDMEPIWYTDRLGTNPLANDPLNEYRLLQNGQISLENAKPGQYELYLGLKNQSGCLTLIEELKKVSFMVLDPVPSVVFQEDHMTFCLENKPILTSLLPELQDLEIKWYDAPVGGDLLDSDTELEDGKTYYAVYINEIGCESEMRMPISVTLISCAPKLSITKKTDYTAVVAGDSLTYELKFKNSGIFTAYNVVVTDTLPIGSEYINSNPSPMLIDDVLVWGFDSLPSGKEEVIKLTLWIKPDVEAGSSINNVAWLDYDENILPLNSEISVVSVKRVSAFLFLKTSKSQEAFSGDTIRYDFFLKNLGPSNADNIQVLDSLHQSLELLFASDGGKLSEHNLLSWEFSSLPVGDSISFNLSAVINPDTFPSTLSNKAYAFLKVFPEEITEAIAPSISISPRPFVDFKISKTIEDPKTIIGEDADYKILLVNTGNVIGNNLVVSDTLSPFITFISARPKPSEVNGQLLQWEFNDVKPNDWIEIDLKVNINYNLNHVGEFLSNKAWINLDGQLIQSSEVRTEILPPPSTSLAISKVSERTSYSIGEVVKYQVSVKNVGDYEAINVQVNDIIPENLMFLEASLPMQLIDEKLLMFQVNRLSVGEMFEFEISFLILGSPEGIINMLEVVGDNVDFIVISSLPLEEKRVDLHIRKEVSASAVEVGADFHYTIQVDNVSDEKATQIIVIDRLPSEVTFVRALPSMGEVEFNEFDNTVSWSLSKLEKAQTETLKIHVRAKEKKIGVTNFAEVNSFEPDKDELSNTALVSHDQMSFHIPNMFSPNGDGVNDNWVIEGLELFLENSLVIVNRWGTSVFSAQNYSNDWSGSNLNEGTYFYKLLLKDADGKMIEKFGYVTLLR